MLLGFTLELDTSVACTSCRMHGLKTPFCLSISRYFLCLEISWHKVFGAETVSSCIS